MLTGCQRRPIRVLRFTNLAPGEELLLAHDVEWSTSNEFPPSLVLAVVCDLDLNLDCGGNNVVTLRPEAISQLFHPRA